MKNSFFNKINYSACNEDSESERKALQLTEEDVVLCVTGSGSRPLDLLIDLPRKIISIDFNVTQNYLLSLKIAAYKTLTYPEFIAFIGIQPFANKSGLYAKVSTQLPREAKLYWDTQFNKIEKGILYSGTWELFLKNISRMAIFRKKKISTLMQSDTLEIQKYFWNKHWNNATWKLFLKILSNRFLWTKIIREPGAVLIPKDFNIYQYIQQRLNYMANHYLLKENHFANLLFYGRYKNTCRLPIHLRPENFEIIKNQVHKIVIVTDSLLNTLNQKEITQQITAYSLSDFSSYANPYMYIEIWKRIATHSKNNTRFCERQFLVKRSPELVHSSIARNKLLEEILYEQDETAIYSFCVGKIIH